MTDSSAVMVVRNTAPGATGGSSAGTSAWGAAEVVATARLGAGAVAAGIVIPVMPAMSGAIAVVAARTRARARRARGDGQDRGARRREQDGPDDDAPDP